MKFTPQALIWLTHILGERFGHAFSLEAHCNEIWLSLVNQSSGVIVFPRLISGFHDTGADIPCALWDVANTGWLSALDQPLPAPGENQLHIPLIDVRASGHCVIHYDIIGLTYWMLTRQEEIASIILDDHGRFPATASHAFKYDYLERPVVDEWLHILGQVIHKTWPDVQIRQHKFNMKVSHDIDCPSRYAFRSWKGVLRAMVGDVVKRKDFISALCAPWVRLNSVQNLHPMDPGNTFDWIMDASERHGLCSAFYFICGRTDVQKDADYEPEHPVIRGLMRRIHSRGHEIGLHPSYGSYQSAEMIGKEAQRLKRIAKEEGIEQSSWGGRMHYLRWEQPTTLKAWADAGMNYESTMSYADHAGFRCGTCFEYPAFDPIANLQLPLRVRPLIAMECSVMAPCYMNLGTNEAALAKFSQLKDSCRAVDGCFTLLWHNSQLYSTADRELYEMVLSV